MQRTYTATGRVWRTGETAVPYPLPMTWQRSYTFNTATPYVVRQLYSVTARLARKDAPTFPGSLYTLRVRITNKG